MPAISQRAPRIVRALGALLAFAPALVTVLAACERRSAAPRVDSITLAPPPPDIPAPTPPPATSAWDGEAGLALVVPGEEGDARLVVPGTGAGAPVDTSAGRADAVLPGEVVLLSRTGVAGRATATAAAPRAAGTCSAWPVTRLGPASGADALPPWTVGLVVPSGGAAVTAIALDSLHGLPSADSAALAAAVTRVASTLPADASARRLQGLPFVVRAAGRFHPDSATEAVVAVLARALAQEASPMAEVILLVAERPVGASPATHWTLAYHERAVGREETLPSAEVLAALQLGASRRAALVVGRGMDDGSRYTLLERVASARWQVRWTSAAPGC